MGMQLLQSSGRSEFQYSKPALVNSQMQRRWNDNGRVFAFDNRRAFDDVARAQRFVRENGRVTIIFFGGPICGPFTLSRRRWIRSFEFHRGHADFLGWHDGLENETLDENSALGVHDEGAESFAELFIERVAYRDDVFFAVH